jgi:general secretion pathway protein G
MTFRRSEAAKQFFADENDMKTNLNRGRKRGFTLTELLVVVVILGILAATIIPQFMGAPQQAKVTRAQTDIAQLQTALDRFSIKMDRFPTTEEGLKALVEAPSGEEKKWRMPYITKLQNDPWGNPYQYRNPGTHNKGRFDLWSRGADNADGGDGDGTDIGNW